MTSVYIRSDTYANAYGYYEYTQDIPNNRTLIHSKIVVYAKFSGGFTASVRTQLYGSYYYASGHCPQYSYTTLNERWDYINHNADGSYPSGAGIQFRESDYESGTVYSSYIDLSTIIPDIPRASEFTSPSGGFSYTIGNTLAVTVDKKYSGFADTLVVKVNGVTIKTDTDFESETITFSSGEIAAMYAACSTVNSATVTLELTTKNGATIIGTDNVSGTAYVTNSNPLFTNYTFADVKTSSLTLTGNNQRIIDNYNTLRVAITTANKAVAQNGATMVRYILNCGSKQVTASWSSSATVTMDLSNVRSASFAVYAEDSRGNQTLVNKTGTFVSYISQAVTSGTITRTNSVEEETTLTLAGTWWDDNFGSSNNVISATYRYKQTSSSTWLTGTTSLSLNTATTNVFSINQTILGDTATGFSITKSFDIEITVTDSVGSYTYYLVITKGEFPLSIGTEGIAVNTLYDDTKNRGLQINGAAYITGDSTMSALTASRIVSTNASKVLTSLSTSTYPSLTELSYVKGLSSAIQTQLNAKATHTELGYSTSEVSTGTTWVGGQTIYKKTISCGTLPSSEGYRSVAHGITNPKTIKIECFIYDGSTKSLSFPYITVDGAYTDSTNVNVHVTTDRSAYTCYTTLYYYK